MRIRNQSICPKYNISQHLFTLNNALFTYGISSGTLTLKRPFTDTLIFQMVKLRLREVRSLLKITQLTEWGLRPRLLLQIS